MDETKVLPDQALADFVALLVAGEDRFSEEATALRVAAQRARWILKDGVTADYREKDIPEFADRNTYVIDEIYADYIVMHAGKYFLKLSVTPDSVMEKIESVDPDEEVPTLPPSMQLSPNFVVVKPGDVYEFTVTKFNVPDTAVVVSSVSGNASADTLFTPEGVLTVGADETAERMQVRLEIEELDIICIASAELA